MTRERDIRLANKVASDEKVRELGNESTCRKGVKFKPAFPPARVLKKNIK